MNTHTFEIKFTGEEKIEGELDWSIPGDGITFIDLPATWEQSTRDLAKITSLLKSIIRLVHKPEDLKKIKIIKK